MARIAAIYNNTFQKQIAVPNNLYTGFGMPAQQQS